MTMTQDEAIRHIRASPEHAAVVKYSYFDVDVVAAGERFARSGEFAETLRLLGGSVAGRSILDVGAGRGIATYAFAKAGAKPLYALEPDPSDEVGRGSLERLMQGIPVTILADVGEGVGLPDATVDIVYCRQVLHHIMDLPQAMREFARVLKPGGTFLGCREHVVDDETQLKQFLADHIVHQLAGGENAYSLPAYQAAITDAGLRLEKTLSTFDSVVNAFPLAHTQAELEIFARTRLAGRWGAFGKALSYVPGVQHLVMRRWRKPAPGRMYTFLARRT